MKRGLTLLVAACVMLCVAACAQQPTKASRAVVVSDSVTCEPLRFSIYLKSADGTITDSARRQPHEVAEDLPAVPWRDDLRIVPGDAETLHSFTLYDSGGEELYYRRETFAPPDELGDYVVSFEARWSGGGEEHGYQYMFKLTVE